MTNRPNVPLRLEFEIEVPGSPEQVWAALATATGQSAWYLPVESDERAGGRQVIHMGPQDAPADITGWDPPRRFALEEDITVLLGRPEAVVTALVTEFVVEARSGGTCVVRVVSSAFGVGAEWEQEFVDDMAANWLPFFDQLRLYLTHFPGQRATTVVVDRVLANDHEAVRAAACRTLGVAAVGDRIDLSGASGTLEQLAPVLLVRLDGPTPGMARVWTGGKTTEVTAYLFPPADVDADAAAEATRRTWSGFLNAVASSFDVEVRR